MCRVPERPEKLKIVARISAQHSITKMDESRPSYNDREDDVEGQRQQVLRELGPVLQRISYVKHI